MWWQDARAGRSDGGAGDAARGIDGLVGPRRRLLPKNRAASRRGPRASLQFDGRPAHRARRGSSPPGHRPARDPQEQNTPSTVSLLSPLGPGRTPSMAALRHPWWAENQSRCDAVRPMKTHVRRPAGVNGNPRGSGKRQTVARRVQGPPGPEGATGDAGIVGAAGASGPAGETGRTGPRELPVAPGPQAQAVPPAPKAPPRRQAPPAARRIGPVLATRVPQARWRDRSNARHRRPGESVRLAHGPRRPRGGNRAHRRHRRHGVLRARRESPSRGPRGPNRSNGRHRQHGRNGPAGDTGPAGPEGQPVRQAPPASRVLRARRGHRPRRPRGRNRSDGAVGSTGDAGRATQVP